MKPTIKLSGNVGIWSVLQNIIGKSKCHYQSKLASVFKGKEEQEVINVYNSSDESNPHYIWEGFWKANVQELQGDVGLEGPREQEGKHHTLYQLHHIDPPLTPPPCNKLKSVDNFVEMVVSLAPPVPTAPPVSAMTNIMPDLTGRERDIMKSENKFMKRVVTRGTEKVIDGTPSTRSVAVAIFGELKDPNSLLTVIAKAKVIDGTPAVGESPGVFDALLEVKCVMNEN